MGKQLCSVGLDVGTSTTQLVVSRLEVENRASSFAVPEMVIENRQVVYESPVYLTPLLEGELVDGAGIRKIVETEYAKAGLRPDRVDTGAVIITGETSRKENARVVLGELSGFAGEFVVATAGPDLESVLAARGAGADKLSQELGKPVLHMDIGGGTTNLALVEEGQIVATGCMNVGGRLLKFDPTGQLAYLSPVLQGLTQLRLGDRPSQTQVLTLARLLVQALEMAAGLRPRDALFDRLQTREASPWQPPKGEVVLSFSGGVADCMQTPREFLAFGDLGPELAAAILESALCRGSYRLGAQTIRATVIGAGCHSAQLSGSTVFCKNMVLPLKNLPVAVVSAEKQLEGSAIAAALKPLEGEWVALALPGLCAPDYGALQQLSRALLEGIGKRQVVICLEQDMAKALGQLLCLQLADAAPILCMDGLRLSPGAYLDVGRPVGPALPVVIKTLVLQTHGKGDAYETENHIDGKNI